MYIALCLQTGGLLCAAAVRHDLPLYFEKNQGQAPEGVGYVSRADGLALLLSRGEAVFALSGGASRVKMHFANGRAVEPVAEGLVDARSNYFIGRDPSKWRTGVENYRAVRYRDVYPGVDFLFYASGRRLEYDIVLAAGADPGRILLSFEGAGSVAIDQDGSVAIRTRAGELRQLTPKVYQRDRSGDRLVAARYVRRGRGRIGLAVGRYDRSRPLVIDPTLSFATYLGGSLGETPANVALDPSGNIYVTGGTLSLNFPVSATPYAAKAAGPPDIYVAKFTAAGTLVYSTYIGGASTEAAGAIAVDHGGNAYVTGTTTSVDFPTASPFQQLNHGGTTGADAFLTKLDPTGGKLVYSTFLGGNDDDVATALAVDSAGAAYVAGFTFSLNFPLMNPIEGFTPGLPIFLTKMNPTGSGLAYSTLIGGSGADLPLAIALDGQGQAYLAGTTNSPDFPLAGPPYQGTNHGGPRAMSDAFLVKVNASGNQLVISTYLGGAGDDSAMGIGLDAAGNIYLTGVTGSTDFPTTAGFLSNALSGPTDAFICKFDPTGTKLLYSTYFGGTRDDQGDAIAADNQQNIYVAGTTSTPGLPLGGSPSSFGGGSDVFVLKMGAAGPVQQGAYLGGPGTEVVTGMALNGSGTMVVTGSTTSSTGLATENASQPRYGGGDADAFIASFNFNVDLNALNTTPAQLIFQGVVGTAVSKQTLTLKAPNGGNPAWSIAAATSNGANWLAVSAPSGTGAGTVDVTVNDTGLAAGNYSGTVTVTDVPDSTKTAIPVTLTLANPGGQVPANGVVNGASFQPGAVSPGLIVTIYGSGIGPGTITLGQPDSSGKLATSVAGAQVLFDGVAAPIVYVSAGQASAIVPYEVAGQTTTQMQLVYNGAKSNTVTVPVALTAPGLFTANSSGTGQGAIQNQDGSFNSDANPAAQGSIIVLYLTGEGQTVPAGVDGQFATDVVPKPAAPVSVTVGGQPGAILYAGTVPGSVAGLMQINLQLPPQLPPGDLPVVVSIGTASSQDGVTVSVSP